MSWKLIDVTKAQVSTSHTVNVAVEGAFILKYVPLFWYSRTGRAALNLTQGLRRTCGSRVILILCYVPFIVLFHYILRLKKCLRPSKLAKIEGIAWKKYPR